MSVSELSLRPFSAEDFPLLASWITTPQELFRWGGPALSFPLEATQLKSMLAEPQRQCWSILLGDAVIGHAQLLPGRLPGILTLGKVILSPERRGQKISHSALKLVLAQAFADSSIEAVELVVLADNLPAQRCYLSLGFQKVGGRKTRGPENAAELLTMRLPRPAADSVLDDGKLVRRYCTPPPQEETDFDKKAFAAAEALDIPFEDRTLRVYRAGSGKDVLLVHGWSSRASHMAMLARLLQRKGVRTWALDMPAHGDSRRRDREDNASLIEFGRAISHVFGKIGGTPDVIGHSMGALAAAFAAAGTGQLAEYKICPTHLVLMSSPGDMERVVENYCRNRNEPELQERLGRATERAFDFEGRDYELPQAVKNIEAKVLVVHDEEDEEIPLADAMAVKEARPDIELLVTKGLGHRKILTGHEVFKAIAGFLAG
jgi:pimeloyl-ACP methyl ester carboxylesterase/RimJ/RimL family protein N-acetyltransferase